MVLVAAAPAVRPVQAQPGLATITYPVRGLPPFELGAPHDTVAAPEPLAIADGSPGADGGESANVTIETFGLTMLCEKPATPTLRTALKEPETEEPVMTSSEVPVAG